MTTQFKLMPGALVALIGLFSSLLPLASAQNPGGYPEWVTNDYDCVIGCLQIFNETVKERPYQAGETEAYKCVTTTCNKDTMAMNIYQTQYIISMFYATGSIYEDPNMGSWTSVPNFFGSSTPAGGAPGGPETGAPNSTTAGQASTSNAGAPTTITQGQPTSSARPIGAPIATSANDVATVTANGSGGNGTNADGSEVVSGAAARQTLLGGWVPVVVALGTAALFGI